MAASRRVGVLGTFAAAIRLEVSDSVQRVASGEVRHPNNALAHLHCVVRLGGGQKIRTHASEWLKQPGGLVDMAGPVGTNLCG